jgi:hypothetical protein
MTISLRIKNLMGEMTVAAFATFIGEERPQRLKDVLRGQQKIPEDMLVRIVERTGCDANWLLLGIGEGKPLRLPEDERILLDNYRHAPQAVQMGIKTTLGAFAASTDKKVKRSA